MTCSSIASAADAPAVARLRRSTTGSLGKGEPRQVPDVFALVLAQAGYP